MSPTRLGSEFTPWGGRTARVQAVATALGAVLILVGWWGGSGSSRTGTQVNWLIVAALGALVAGLGHALFLLDAQRRVASARRSLLGDTVPVPVPVAVPPGSGGPSPLVAVPGARRYHRPGCHLVAGKATTVVAAGDEGRTPCEVCRP